MSAVARVKRPAGEGVVGIHGPRPQPLSLPAAARPSKRPRSDDGAPEPIIVYEHTPKVIHVRPDEFKALVQRLTGRQQQPMDPAVAETTTSAAASPQEEAATTTAGDPLVLTLVKKEPLRQQLEDHYTPVLQLPSPGAGPAGLAASDFLFSPGSFLFSPATMRAIQELIS